MKKILFRLTILVLILAVFIYYISKNFTSIENTIQVTLSQSLGFILLAAILCTLAYYFMVLMNKSVFDMMGIKRTMTEMAILQMSSLAINVLVPSGGVSVSLMFAGDAHERGESRAAAVTAGILGLLVDYISIAILLTFATVYLFFLGALDLTVTIPALAFYAVTVGLYLLIYLAGKNKIVIRRLLCTAKKLANKVLVAIKRKKILKDESVIDNFIDELENAYVVIAKDKADFIKSIGIILVSHLMYLGALYVLFISFGITPLLRVLITGYAIGMMFMVISPTPNGVGFVEGSMTLAYTSMGVTGASAAAVTLIYRGFSFWLPLFAGFVAVQRKHLMKLVREGTGE